MTEGHRPSIEISRYLTRECGIPFKEAAEARAKILKECGMTVFDQSLFAQANLNVYHAKRDEEKKAETNAKRQATRQANKLAARSSPFHQDFLLTYQAEPSPKKDSCVSCGDETFQCGCEVKTVDQIPF